MTIDVYTFELSPPAVGVLYLAKYLGIHLNEIELNLPLGEHHKPEYKKMFPQCTVPSIDDNGFTLFDSQAIMAYLVMKYAKNDSLYPKNPEKRAIIEQRMYFIMDIFGSMRNYLSPIAKGQPPDTSCLAIVEKGIIDLDTVIQDSKFIAGDELSIADFSALSIVSIIKYMGLDIGRYYNVITWFKNCESLLGKYGYKEYLEKLDAFFSTNFQQQ